MRMIIKKLRDILDERKKDQEAKRRIRQCRKLIKYLNNDNEKTNKSSSLVLPSP